MPKADGRKVVAGAVILLLAAVLPFAWPWTVAAVFLTPVLAECCRAGGKQRIVAAAVAVMSLSGYVAGTPVQWCLLGGVWALAAVVMDTLPGLNMPLRRTAAWLAISAVMAGAGVTLLRLYYGGAVCQGMAEDAVSWLAAREDANDILLAALQMGYARLSASGEMLPGFRFLGRTVLLTPVRTELLNSLRTTLTDSLQELVPSAVVFYLGVVAFLTAYLPEVIRRRRGRATLLPPMTRWYIPREHALGAMLLALFALVRYMTEYLAVYQAGVMCLTAFYLLYGLQGLCLALWWLRRRRLPPGAGLLMGVAVFTMLPMAGMLLTLLGACDQLLDPRALRGQPEETDDDEGGT
ncbi:MAG: DUF2232 domain-containing protein [Aristaeellaceae bacterium]